MDYPNPLLIEYLKFDFQLSVLKHNDLNITTVIKHLSAIHFSQAVDEYFVKELAYGTILGLATEIQSDLFHCCTLLTRPKDVVKRMVILNISHSNGGSLNNSLDKFRFHHTPFTLTLISVDYIVKEIYLFMTILLFKIGVARAFRNLRWKFLPNFNGITCFNNTEILAECYIYLSYWFRGHTG